MGIIMIILDVILVSLLVREVQLQEVEWAVTCVTDPAGTPRMTIENDSEDPLIFGLVCDYNAFEIYLDPYATETFRIYFPGELSPEDDDYECVLNQWSMVTFGIPTFVYDFIEDWEFGNATFCSPVPGVEDGVHAYTDCELGRDGDVIYNYVNNLVEDLSIDIYCFDVYYVHNGYYEYDECQYSYDMDGLTRIQIGLELFDFQHGGDLECVLVPYEYGFELPYEIWSPNAFMFFYLEGNLHCNRRRGNDRPIAEVIPHCPSTSSGDPVIELRADVAAYAIIHCRNGDAHLSTATSVSTSVDGEFSQGSTSDCQFYKQEDSLIWTVTVEVGWGIQGQEIFLDSKIQTISCVYDAYGIAESSVERVGLPNIPPDSKTDFIGGQLEGIFDVQVLDVLGRLLNSFSVATGSRIQLKIIIKSSAEPISDIKAYSCTASNGVTSYDILQNGCGDGFVISNDEGFTSAGRSSYSPYFKMFHLRGGRNIWFDCAFTECDGPCPTSSCDYEGISPGQPTILGNGGSLGPSLVSP